MEHDSAAMSHLAEEFNNCDADSSLPLSKVLLDSL